MGKRKKEWEERKHILVDLYGVNFVEVIPKLDVASLLFIGERFASLDYAVRFYKNKKHPTFFGNRKALEGAINRFFPKCGHVQRCELLDYIERYQDKIHLISAE